MALSPDEYSRLLQFLGQASAYSHHPKEVEHIQTHISHVFIAESLVYKIKKPVNLGFLDYSTLKKREHYCQREVELNRRLCDDAYLGVVPITREGDSFVLKGNGEAVEFAVEMEKLQEKFFLHSYVENNTLTRKHLDRIADTLADFYLEQDPGPEILQYGEIEKIKINTDENFDQTEKFIGETIDRLTFDTIRQYTNQYYQQKEQLFRRRIKQKRIVDGHGDLHLDHIHITPEKVRIYDCIEFNERFRYGDVAADLAYLAMDLDFVGRRKEERYFVAQMSRRMEDPDLHRLLDFYKCYRAYVKGKVKSIQSTEQEVDKEDRKEAAQKAARYFDLSLRYALLGSEPVALIFMGRIGTGKSTLANQLSEKLGIEACSSDRIRKTLAGLPLKQRTPAEQRKSLYSPEMSRKTYDKLQSVGIERLEDGRNIIMDATFSSRELRSRIIERLEKKKFNYVFIEAQASDGIIKKRLKERDRKQVLISDARLEDFESLDKYYQPPQEIPPENLVEVNTGQPLDETLQNLYTELVDRHLKEEG